MDRNNGNLKFDRVEDLLELEAAIKRLTVKHVRCYTVCIVKQKGKHNEKRYSRTVITLGASAAVVAGQCFINARCALQLCHKRVC